VTNEIRDNVRNAEIDKMGFYELTCTCGNKQEVDEIADEMVCPQCGAKYFEEPYHPARLQTNEGNDTIRTSPDQVSDKSPRKGRTPTRRRSSDDQGS
jgi:hypothetical protein